MMKKSNVLIAAVAMMISAASAAKAEEANIDFDGENSVTATLATTLTSYDNSILNTQCEALMLQQPSSAGPDTAQGNFADDTAKKTTRYSMAEEDANDYLKALAQLDRSQSEEIQEEILKSPLPEKIDYMTEHYVPHLIRKVSWVENKDPVTAFLGTVLRRPGFVCARYETKTTCGTKKIVEWVCEAVGEVVNGTAGKICSWVTSFVEDCSTHEVCVEWDQV